eukprot:PRCOL_00002409-RA
MAAEGDAHVDEAPREAEEAAPAEDAPAAEGRLNLAYAEQRSAVEDLFKPFGTIDRVDLKKGFAFVYMSSTAEAEAAVAQLVADGTKLSDRLLKIEISKGHGRTRERERKRRAALSPTTTLFVVNFPLNDMSRIRPELERVFGEFGKITRFEVRGSFAFIGYAEQADATKALETMHDAEFEGEKLTVDRSRSGSPGGR